MSPKNARLKTNGDQSSSARIWTDATLGFLKGKLSIRIRSRGKFTVRCRVKYSFHFEICVVAMAGTLRTRMRTRSKFGINFGATAGTSQILELNSLQFENHLVIDYLPPKPHSTNEPVPTRVTTKKPTNSPTINKPKIDPYAYTAAAARVTNTPIPAGLMAHVNTKRGAATDTPPSTPPLRALLRRTTDAVMETA